MCALLTLAPTLPPTRCTEQTSPESLSVFWQWPAEREMMTDSNDVVVSLALAPMYGVTAGSLVAAWHYRGLIAEPRGGGSEFAQEQYARRRRSHAAKKARSDTAAHHRIERSARRYAAKALRDKHDNAAAKALRASAHDGGRSQPRALEEISPLFGNEDHQNHLGRTQPYAALAPSPLTDVLVRLAVRVLQLPLAPAAVHPLHTFTPPVDVEEEAEAIAEGQRAPSNAAGCVCELSWWRFVVRRHRRGSLSPPPPSLCPSLS